MDNNNKTINKKLKYVNQIPDELKNTEQWVCYDYDKMPYNPKTGDCAKTNDSSTWGTYQEALSTAKNSKYAGVGYVFSRDDLYVGIDLDRCLNPKTGKLEDWAQKIIIDLNSYTEVSPSGKGVHIIAKGSLPSGGNKKDGVEMYDNGRYFTMTGDIFQSMTNIKNRENEIVNLHNKIFGQNKTSCLVPIEKQKVLSDKEVKKLIYQSKNYTNFIKLMKGNYTGYPSQSEADLALAGILACYCGDNENQIDRIFRQSKLMRPKWDEKHSGDGLTYGQMTIKTAINNLFNPLSKCRKIVNTSIQQAINNPKQVLNIFLEDKDLLKALAFLSIYDLPDFELTMHKLEEIKIRKTDIDAIRRSVKAEVKKLNENLFLTNSKSNKLQVKVTLPFAPVSKNILVPGGYEIDANGIFRIENLIKTQIGFKTQDRTVQPRVATSPVLIKGRLKDIDGKEYIILTFFRDELWNDLTVPRIVTADPSKLLELADHGFPVIKSKASDLVEFIHLFEQDNINYLPCGSITTQMGWIGNDPKKGFMWGRNFLPPNGDKLIPADLRSSSPNSWKKNIVFFKGIDTGDERLANAFQQKGSFRKWCIVIKKLDDYPIVKFMLCASFTAPLLGIIKIPNFIVDLAFRTTIGKTTTLKVAASIWGNPDEKADDSALRPWDTTQVWIERSLGILNGIPLILDETKQIKNQDFLSKVIYGVSSGKGRGRGSLQGTASSHSWQTLILSSGESKITDLVSKGHGGVHARVISIFGAPFGAQSEEIAEFINKELIPAISENYGHAGYRLVQYLLRNQEKWNKWQSRFKELMTDYEEIASGNSIASRLAPYMAAVHLAGILAKNVLNLPWKFKKDFHKIFTDIVADIDTTANTSLEALKQVVSKAYSKMNYFHNQQVTEGNPPEGWLGIWNSYEDLAFFPHKLDEILKNQGYEPEAIKRDWKKRGWLNTKGEKKGLTKKISFEGERTRFVVIKRQVVDKVNEGTLK